MLHLRVQIAHVHWGTGGVAGHCCWKEQERAEGSGVEAEGLQMLKQNEREQPVSGQHMLDPQLTA